MFNNKISIIGLIVLILFISLSLGAVQAADASELSDTDAVQDIQLSSIGNSQLSNYDLLENSNGLEDNILVSGDCSIVDKDSLDLYENQKDNKSISEKTINQKSATKKSINSNNTINSKNQTIPTNSYKKSTKISVNKINTYYKEKSKLLAYLKDSNNRPIKNRAVKIFLNGKTFSKTTDSFGKIILNLNLKPNKYGVKISFSGDNDYKGSSISTIINVKKAPLSIKTSNAKSYFHPDTFFKAKVINKITKNPIEGIKVLFQVYSSRNNFKNYYSITDKNGIATLKNRLKTGFYDVYTYIKDNAKKNFISYNNPKNKVVLRVMDTKEMGCSSIFVHVNAKECALAFRRDATYAADLHVVAQKWYGRYAVKQYKLTGTYFFHGIVTSDGWMIATGGFDNPTINRKIEDLAGKMVMANSIKSAFLKKIKGYERSLSIGHFAIVAPNGRFGVVWSSGYITGRLKNGQFLNVPNARSLFRQGDYSKFSKDPAKAALKIAATDVFGVNRRNIMTYHYKRSDNDFKASSTVNVYASNDKGNLAGRYTAGKSDNVYYKNKFISRNKLYGTPNQRFLGIHNFGNIDKIIKTQTIVNAKNITSIFNQSKIFRVSIKDKETKKALSNVRFCLKIFTGENYKTYFLRTNKNGIVDIDVKALKVGNHEVFISTANNKYLVSARSNILITDE